MVHSKDGFFSGLWQKPHFNGVQGQFSLKSTVIDSAHETTKQSQIVEHLLKQPHQERDAAAVTIPRARNRGAVDLVAGARGRPGEGGRGTRASRGASASHPTRKSPPARQLAGGWEEVKTGEAQRVR